MSVRSKLRSVLAHLDKMELMRLSALGSFAVGHTQCAASEGAPEGRHREGEVRQTGELVECYLNY